jgi:tetratricopeptide (TPR) repeat protein
VARRALGTLIYGLALVLVLTAIVIVLENISWRDGGLRDRAKIEEHPRRTKIAILPLENGTGDPGLWYWRSAGDRIVAKGLREIKELQVSPDVRYALKRLSVKKDGPFNARSAQRVGDLISARIVLWGEYQKRNAEWIVSVHVFDTIAKRILLDTTAASTNWFDIRDELVARILEAVELHPVSVELLAMKTRWTTSATSLDSIMKAAALEEEGSPWTEIGQCAREALQADSTCADAYGFLAVALANQGRLKEAEDAGIAAVQLDSNNTGNHRLLGNIYCLQSELKKGEEQFQKAIESDPDNSAAFEGLGEIYGRNGQTELALVNYRRALLGDLLSANNHAHLGAFCVAHGKLVEGRKELRNAEELVCSDDLTTEESLSRSFADLHDWPLAIKHTTNVIELLKKQGSDPTMTAQYETGRSRIEARLVCHFITNSEPKIYSNKGLTAALRNQLDPKELALVENPLMNTPAMARWARQVTDGGTNDLEKARLLFVALDRPVDELPVQPCTAQRLFETWNTDGASVHCLDLSCLYVALARSLGLSANEVYVREACDGQKTWHVCAAVFVENRGVLVDVAYGWFGVQHKKFVVLDDLQAIAFYMSLFENFEKAKIALRLAPDLAPVQMNFMAGLIDAGRWEEVDNLVSRIMRSDGDGWISYFMQAQVARHKNNLPLAIELARKAMVDNPQNGAIYSLLADMYWSAGRLNEAEEAFRNALRCPLDEKQTQMAKWAILKIEDARAKDGRH